MPEMDFFNNAARIHARALRRCAITGLFSSTKYQLFFLLQNSISKNHFKPQGMR
jgi:hypothetical protein